MAEVHVTVSGPKNEVSIAFHNPGQRPLPAGAGQPVVATGTGNNKSVSGQVSTSLSTVAGPIVRNPA